MLDSDIVIDLKKMFHKYYKYIDIFHYALEHIMLIKDKKVIIRADKRPDGEYEKKYNAPVA